MISPAPLAPMAKITRPAYRIIKGPLPNLVTAEMSGLWTAEDFSGFIAILASAVRTLQCPQAYMLLADLRHFPIQTQPVMALFQQNMRERARFRRCGAIITPQSPVVLQLRRLICQDPRVRLFESRECALAWLRTPAGANDDGC